MYTNEDLNFAIDQGIFSKESVSEFRLRLENHKKTRFVDEENFRLINSFNDIFVVIACGLLLFSTLWVARSVNDSFGIFAFFVLSWCLSEFFTLKRKMALPSISLLLAFVGGVFVFFLDLYDDGSEISFVMAAAAASVSAYLHWRRFGVPITIAAGTAAIVSLAASVELTIHPDGKTYLLPILFICGVVTFVFAMHWDSSDRARTTNKSDVAFWLHLLAAPLIIHPVFSSLGIFDGSESVFGMLLVIILYALMTLLSITVDRRAFMVSSLVYVVFAISNILREIGGLNYSFALTGMLIGSGLLILSVYWQEVRAAIITRLPETIQKYVPELHSRRVQSGS
ncbi:hypothetical protein [Gilvimarinus polysaccharolyticus]|uniref:hypothetical protein n=1 Tax=Gilvimarinus polysaccharolyticus TaxID=863921 RepID=UPI0006739BB4|nr:hypothetical protein [Gilvimarinus polysaccharolyticus]